jgi:hypothetical protein
MPAKSEKQARLKNVKKRCVICDKKLLIKPSSIKHFTKVKEIIQRLKESEYSLSKIKKVSGISFQKHLSKQVGVPFDLKELQVFQTKENGFSGFGKTKFKENKSTNEISTEINSNSTNKKYVFKKLVDNEDKQHKYACIIQRTFPDKPDKEILDLLSNSFDNENLAEKTKTLADFIDRINTTLGSM